MRMFGSRAERDKDTAKRMTGVNEDFLKARVGERV